MLIKEKLLMENKNKFAREGGSMTHGSLFSGI